MPAERPSTPARSTQPAVGSPIERFVALGDSFTEGLEDVRGPDGRHRGWADRVAAALAVEHPGLGYANLAVRGRLIGEVIAEQLPVVRDLPRCLVSFHAGGNDLLRPGAAPQEIAARYDAAVAGLRAVGHDVVLFTVLERAGGRGWLADALARRFAAFNDQVRGTAQRHGALLVDIGSSPVLQDARFWHADRLHLAPQGHARVAAAVIERLGIDDPRLLGGAPRWWDAPLGPSPRSVAGDRLARDLRWGVQHLLPWLGRRLRGVSSGDGCQPRRPALTPVEPAGDDLSG